MEPALRKLIPRKAKARPRSFSRAAVPIRLGANSAAQAQARNQRFVALDVLRLHIVEQAATLRHHLDHAAAGMIVLGVGLEVLGEVGDALRQDRDLHLRRTGVIVAGRVLGDQLFLAFRGNHSVIRPFKGYVEKLKTRNGRSSPSAISANATGDPSASFKNTVWPWSSPSPNPSCMRAKRFARMRMGLPDRMRTVSGPETASAGMPSSAVARGLKYPKAAGLCIKGVRVSSPTAPFSSQAPSRLRRKAETCPRVPKAWAMSRTQD